MIDFKRFSPKFSERNFFYRFCLGLPTTNTKHQDTTNCTATHSHTGLSLDPLKSKSIRKQQSNKTEPTKLRTNKEDKQLAIRQFKQQKYKSTQRHCDKCHFIKPVQPYGWCNRDTVCDIRFIMTISVID